MTKADVRYRRGSDILEEYSECFLELHRAAYRAFGVGEVISDILPPPTSQKELFERQVNWWRAGLIPQLSISKRIEVKDAF